MVCHPSKTFPLKSLSRNPKIGFPLSQPLDYALLPLTYDLTTSCISWVQAGDVWALCVLHFHEHPKSACCSRVHHGLKDCLHILPPILGFLWCEPFSHSLKPAPFEVGLLFGHRLFILQPTLLLFSTIFAFPAIPLCYSCFGVI